MEIPSILPILKKNPIFAGLNEDQHQKIISNIVLNYFPVGHVFFNQEESGGSMYIIQHGMVKISRKNTLTGEDQEVITLADHDFFGEMALVSNAPRNATATAIADCTVLELKKDDFMTLMQTDPTLAEKVSKEIVDRDKKNNK